MPVRGRKTSFQSNRVANPQYIPPFMVSGKVTWNNAMDAFGTASIEYEGLEYEVLQQVRQALPIDKIENIYGLQYKIKSFSYNHQNFSPNDQSVDRYSVSIALEEYRSFQGIQIKTITPVNLDSIQGDIGFPADVVISDGQNTYSRFDQGYYDAELTFGSNSDEGGGSINDEPKTVFRLKDSVSSQLLEGDSYAKIPPTNTTVLRDSTSNFDESGPKKILKRTVRQDGQLLIEEMTTYGFAYLYEDIRAGIANINAGAGDLYDTNPQRFWQPVEFKRTVYNYQGIGSLVLRVTVIPPGDSGVVPRSVKFIIHPDYSQFASIGEESLSGFNVAFRSNAQYLVSSVTTGWKLLRLKKEDNSRSTLDPLDPYYPFFHFRKTPYYAQTYYKLKNSRVILGKDSNLPFKVEFTEYSKLPLGLQQRFSQEDITDGKVAILYPDPNYVEPLYIEVESSQSNSFVWANDPEGSVNPDEFIPGTNRHSLPHLMSGEESFSETRRIILFSDLYTEYVVQYSSQDPGFDNSAELYSFREVSGQPPQPQNRIRQYDSKQVQPGGADAKSAKDKKYLVSTPQFQKYVSKGGSVSVPTAKSLGAAVQQLRDQLRKAYIQANPGQKTVAWFYPSLRSGCHCYFGGDRIANRTDGTSWVITSVTWSLEYRGRNNDLDDLLVTTPGTQLQLGLDMPNMQIAIRADTSGSDAGVENPIVDTRIVSQPTTASDYFPPLPNRRNF